MGVDRRQQSFSPKKELCFAERKSTVATAISWSFLPHNRLEASPQKIGPQRLGETVSFAPQHTHTRATSVFF